MAKKTKGKAVWLWGSALLFGAGYLATRLMIAFAPGRYSSLVTGLIVLLTIPFAAVTRSVLRGLLRGLFMGFSGSLGIAAAVLGQQQITEVAVTFFLIAASSTLICCAVAGALFAHLAAKRYEQLYGD